MQTTPTHTESSDLPRRQPRIHLAGLAALLSFALFAGAAYAGQPVNVNTASAETIAESLDGVGMTKANAIVDYRKAQGPFKHADELVNVKGIGLSTVDRNRDYIRLSDDKKVASGN